MASDPESPVAVESDAVGYVAWNVYDSLKSTCRTVLIDLDPCDGTAVGLHEVQVVLAGIECNGVGCVDRLRVPEFGLSSSGLHPVETAVDLLRPITTVG